MVAGAPQEAPGLKGRLSKISQPYYYPRPFLDGHGPLPQWPQP